MKGYIEFAASLAFLACGILAAFATIRNWSPRWAYVALVSAIAETAVHAWPKTDWFGTVCGIVATIGWSLVAWSEFEDRAEEDSTGDEPV